MAEVTAALEAAHNLRLDANTVAQFNPKKAIELIKKADELYYGEPPSSAGSEEEAVKIWEEAHGGSMDDPEFRDKIYKKMAEYRKMEQEKERDAAKQQAAREKLSADLRQKAQQGTRRRTPRAPTERPK